LLSANITVKAQDSCDDCGGTVTTTDTICLLGVLCEMTVITEGFCEGGECRWKQVDAYTEYIGPCDTTLVLPKDKPIKILYDYWVSPENKAKSDFQTKTDLGKILRDTYNIDTKGTKYDLPNYFSEEISPVQEWFNQQIIWTKTTVTTDDDKTLIFTLPWIIPED